MLKVNLHDAKTHLSEYLAKGEVIIVCKRNIPIAEIRPLPTRAKNRRPFGLAKKMVKILPSFYEPLPDDLIDTFYSKKQK